MLVVRRASASTSLAIPSRRLQRGALAERTPVAVGVSPYVKWSRLGKSTTRLPQPPEPTFGSAVHRSAVDLAWKQAHEERFAWVQDVYGAPTASPQTPKDLSVTPRYFYARCNSEVGARFVSQFARIGLREGFRLVVESNDFNRFHIGEDARAAITVVPTSGPHGSDWSEDDGGFDAQGSISVPARIGSTEFIDRNVVEDRRSRLMGLSDDFTSCGQVDITSQQQYKIALALAGNRRVRENLSYVEGGNILLGTLPNGERYGIVGRDSVALTRALLQRDALAHHNPLLHPRRKPMITYHRAMMAIAKDHGLDVKNLFAVEQPGDYHLDMSMALMARGQVLLNDAREAAELEINWLMEKVNAQMPSMPFNATPGSEAEALYLDSFERWQDQIRAAESYVEGIRLRAERRAAYEARTAQDLQKAGLQVFRVPGRFDWTLAYANFLNGEGGTNADGEAFFITQGADPRAQAYIADAYLRRLPTGLQRLYFLDAEASAASLALSGGLGCRAKAEGDVLSSYLVRSPAAPLA